MADHHIIIRLIQRVALFHITVVHGIAKDQVHRHYIYRIIISVVPVHTGFTLRQLCRGDHCPRHTQISRKVIQVLNFHQRIEKVFKSRNAEFIAGVPVQPHRVVFLYQFLVVDQRRISLFFRIFKNIHELAVDLKSPLRDRVKTGIAVRNNRIEHPFPVHVKMEVIFGVCLSYLLYPFLNIRIDP